MKTFKVGDEIINTSRIMDVPAGRVGKIVDVSEIDGDRDYWIAFNGRTDHGRYFDSGSRICLCSDPNTSATIRVFEGGATRDADADKLDISGFLSPLVAKRYSEYMHEHRRQADGSLRSSRNWRKGIPKESYQESMARHHLDAQLHLDGFGEQAREPLEAALCGLLFNVQGLLHELVLEREGLERGRVD